MGIFGKKKTEDKKPAVKKDSQASVAASKEKKEEKSPKMKDLYSGTKPAAGKAKSPQGQIKTEKKYQNAYKVLIKPLITEKAANLGAQNKYVFEVDPKANKIEIAKAIAQTYGVKPVDVNVIKNKGKQVRYGRITGRRKSWKKAIVCLPAGQTIKIYEGV